MDVLNFSRIQNLYNIRQFLAGGGNPNHCDQYQDTLLHLAAKVHGCFEVVEELVRVGALVNVVNVWDLTPLHIAVIYRNRAVVNALIHLGALVNTQDCFGNSVLHSSIITCVSMDKDWYCINPQCTHRVPDMKIVDKLLLHEGIDVNKKNARGDTPLLWAIKEEYYDIAQALLGKSALVNISNHYLETPLHTALSHPKPNIDIVSELVRRGACMHCFDVNFRTPLDLIFKRLENAELEKFAEEFVKLITFYDKENNMITLALQNNSVFFRLHRKCLLEIKQMQKCIFGKKSLYDIVLDRMIDTSSAPLEIQLVTEISRVVFSMHFPIYLVFILKYISSPVRYN